MTMHLAQGLSTLNTKKPKLKKLTKIQLDKLKTDHRDYNQTMKRMGRLQDCMSFDDYVAYARGCKIQPRRPMKTLTIQSCMPKDTVPSFDGGTRMAAKVEPLKYTGTLVKGIAVLHKSCMQPVINKQQAIEAATMRRN